jgi:hypothetical protein
MGALTSPLIVALLRGYVTSFVNRQDFSAMPQYLAENYTLYTGGAGDLRSRRTLPRRGCETIQSIPRVGLYAA